jgi:hypothetical protein|tara:strand:- start:78 stop:566 length:489 start_codon:yes stop_codon:yes gene_type:complete
MIDPLTAIAAASAAYNGVKKVMEAGKEIEDVTQTLGKWFGALNDINRAEQQRKNPPLHAKLAGGASIEEEAFAIIAHQKKMKEQEKEMAFMLNMRFGPNTWDEMMQLRREIKKQREDTIYAAEEFKHAVIDGAIMVALSFGILGMIFTGVYFIGVVQTPPWW